MARTRVAFESATSLNGWPSRGLTLTDAHGFVTPLQDFSACDWPPSQGDAPRLRRDALPWAVMYLALQAGIAEMLLNRTHSATLESMSKSKQAKSNQDERNDGSRGVRHAPASDSKVEKSAALGFNQAQVPREGRLGGIDYGTVRIGIATCDPSQTWATPYDTYACRSPALDDAYFHDLAASQNLVGWVIGLPIHCDGQESQKSKEVRKFAARLANATSLPCCFYDERFSTREARRLLQDSGLGHQKKKSRLDRLAAHLILSHFLDSRSCRSATEIPESSSTHPLED